jgi:hypothetical protein
MPSPVLGSLTIGAIALKVNLNAADMEFAFLSHLTYHLLYQGASEFNNLPTAKTHHMIVLSEAFELIVMVLLAEVPLINQPKPLK